MEILDSLNCPLEGTSLIEAAAGTGKTYNILNIVMRLLVEKKYPIDSIAVLSFTNEAADELKNRLRRLIDAVLAEIDGLPSDDDQAKKFVDKYRRSGTEEITNIRKILRIVQRDFDDARIATINGFCHRILSENAFESGISFNAELDTMPEMKLNVLFNDWERRRRCYGKYSEIFAAVELKTQRKELRGYVDDKSLEIIGGEVDIERTAEKINDALNVVFSSGAVELMERVTDYFSKNSKVVTRLKTLKELLQKRKINRKLFDILKEYLPDKVSSVSLKAYKEATGVLLENPFFSKCEEISNSMKKLKAALYRNMLTEVAQKFEELKESGNFITYKDQIQRLKEALDDDSFCEMLRKKFNAGVVDEFQDTDAQQYAIFKKLFCGDETSERSCFFVGDPRQAIYGFRGGDLFVYLDAKRYISKNGKIYCLDTNYRSSVGMVKCVNDIFAKHPLPFGDEQLKFPELKSRSPKEAPNLIVNGAEDPQSLRLQTLTANEDPYKVCVGRIVDLLEGRGGLLPENGGKVPTSSDIAVLVKGHDEAAKMRNLLRDAGIMAVCSKSGNIFKSEQAGELYSLLSALINPLDRTKVNTALVTKVCGVTFDELQKEDEVVGIAWGRLHSLSGIWRKRSFIAMFETMLSCFHVRERFASLPDGERGLTNLLHLGEVLQNLSVRFDFSPEALLREFAGFIADDSDVEEFQEQLYAERDAVRIMTYHASKGLEFPIVMVPNMQACQWNQHTSTYIYHNEESVRQINLESLDNGSMPDAVKENRLELLRICYVVLTRAKYRCEVFYQDNDKNKFSAMDYLFRPTVIGSAVDNSIPANFREHKFCIPFFKNEICEEAVYSGKNEQYTQLVSPEKVGSIKSDWRVISYSSLTGDNSASGTELPFDRDENQDEKEREDDKKLKNLWPFNLPHGNQFGIAIHWLYEKADFTASESDFSKLVSDTFRNFRLLPGENDKEEITAKAASWLYGVLHSPLPDSDGSSFTLSEIRQADKIAELEFNYSLGTFSAKELREALSDYVCGDELGLRAWPQNWEMELQGGVLNGFVDLLFRRNGKYYIIDWKTNCIGNRMENFFNDGLKHEMVKKLYFLQYLLYLAALIRHLRCFYGGRFGEEEYEKEIGGVYYMFVRGMSPEFAGRGVFYARPPWQTMEKLEKILCS